MEKGDKPKAMPVKKPSKKGKKIPLKKRVRKPVAKASQIVKVNVTVGKDSSEAKKPIRKDISKQTTYVTLETPYALPVEEEEKLSITKFTPIPPRAKAKAKLSPLTDYIINTDDAKISNPNTGEIINIENEPELEDDFGLASSQTLGYVETGEVKPSGTIIGMMEAIEKRGVGRPSKYATDEERLAAIKEQKKQSKARLEEQRKAEAKQRVTTEYDIFLQGVDPFQYAPLEQDLLTEIVLPEIQFGKSAVTKYFGDKEKQERISSDFISNAVDKSSEANNFNLIQSNLGDGNELIFE